MFALLCVGCTDEKNSREALESMGFTDIELTGYEFWSCAKSDDFHTGFVAKNAQGRRVTGVVCCGIMKDCTVRF